MKYGIGTSLLGEGVLLFFLTIYDFNVIYIITVRTDVKN